MKYIDTNVFIYALENHPTYGSACIRILEDIQNEKLKAMSSHITLIEIMNITQKMNNISESKRKPTTPIHQVIGIILSYPIAWTDISLFTIKKASEYENKLLASDRVHIASMALNDIKEIISADKDFDNIPDIRRIDPLTYKK